MNKDRPICKKCSRTVATKSGNTSNLLLHLRNARPEVYKGMKGGEGSSKTAEKRATGGQLQQTLEGAITRSTPLRTQQQAMGEADERNHVLCG